MTTWNLEGTVHHVLICNGGSCMKLGAEEVTTSIREQISLQDADDRIHTTRTRCNGRCSDGCVVIVYPDGVWYRNVTPEDAPVIVQQHVLNGTPYEKKALYTYERSGLAACGTITDGERKK